MFRLGVGVALSLGLLLLILPLAPRPVAANGGELLLTGSPESLWYQLEAIRSGIVPSSFMQTVSRFEASGTCTAALDEPCVGAQNEWSFSLTPYAFLSRLPYSLEVGAVVPYRLAYLFDTLPAYLSMADDLSLGDRLHGHIEHQFRPDIGKMAGPSLTSYPFDTNSTHGYVSYALPGLTLAAGRFPTGIGNGYFGNTFLNGLANYYDHVEVSYYNDHFKFMYLAGTSDAQLTDDELPFQPVNEREEYKFYAYHQMEFKPWDWLALSLGEAEVIGGAVPSLMSILPFTLWHNVWAPGSNIMAGACFSAVPFPGLNVYGEASLDDYPVPGIEDPDSNPAAVAYQVGARYVFCGGSDSRQMVGAEFTHVDPWMYGRLVPLQQLLQRQPYQTRMLIVEYPLGYAYGPDLNHWGVYYRQVTLKGRDIRVSFDCLTKGEINIGLDGDGQPWFVPANWTVIKKGPYGVPEQRYSLSAQAQCPLSRSLSVVGGATASLIQNLGHVAGAAGGELFGYAGITWRF